MRSRQDDTFRPSRRSFLKGKVSDSSAHIASLLVQARPEKLSEVQHDLNNMPGIEVHTSGENGRLVVTVEADNDGQLLDQMRDIENTQGVIVVSLVYHQIEDVADDQE